MVVHAIVIAADKWRCGYTLLLLYYTVCGGTPEPTTTDASRLCWGLSSSAKRNPFVLFFDGGLMPSQVVIYHITAVTVLYYYMMVMMRMCTLYLFFESVRWHGVGGGMNSESMIRELTFKWHKISERVDDFVRILNVSS